MLACGAVGGAPLRVDSRCALGCFGHGPRGCCRISSAGPEGVALSDSPRAFIHGNCELNMHHGTFSDAYGLPTRVELPTGGVRLPPGDQAEISGVFDRK